MAAISILSALALFLPAGIGSQSASPAPCEGDIYRAFDFWIGEWEVSSPTGQVQGRNSIVSEEGGCLIVERWTSATGGTGQSYNFYDLERDAWRQVWVSAGFTIDYDGGLDDNGNMVLEGTIAYRTANLPDAPFRGIWTPNSDGTVTQTFFQYDADQQEWQPWFTGIYRRIAAPTAE